VDRYRDAAREVDRAIEREHGVSMLGASVADPFGMNIRSFTHDHGVGKAVTGGIVPLGQDSHGSAAMTPAEMERQAGGEEDRKRHMHAKA